MDIIIVIFGGGSGGSSTGGSSGYGCGCFLLLLIVVAFIAGSGPHSTSPTYNSAQHTSSIARPIQNQPIQTQKQKELAAVVKRWLVALSKLDFQTLRTLTCARTLPLVSLLQNQKQQLASQLKQIGSGALDQLDIQVTQTNNLRAEINGYPNAWLQYENGWKVCFNMGSK